MFLIALNENFDINENTLREAAAFVNNAFIIENFEIVKKAILDDLTLVIEAGKDETNSLGAIVDIKAKLDAVISNKESLKDKSKRIQAISLINLALVFLVSPLVASISIPASIFITIISIFISIFTIYKINKFRSEEKDIITESNKIAIAIRKTEDSARKTITDKKQLDEILAKLDDAKDKHMEFMAGEKNI